ncbi:putative gamma-glutamylcyclotransferase YkqA [Collibacillus ludicampi]|uniref:Gamma-glutamylcyclotransferase family protein n=1 Tax=Collibacillus ludicampi TaxID=2771369 RepID=A0AAV4LFQ2_9BACL|nr:gamma-glutamylcyclotransferase family protein [Collibacillus ludicampi]GIM46649.1 putative gamma-glutamylcyclotransferase YkqA [Collibacillus ludicampi]
MKKDSSLVFVYGTLRRHETNFHFLKNAERVAAQCWTYGQLFNTGEGYPAMIESMTERVYGELYRVTPNELKALDQLEDYYGEGCHNLYDRIRQTVYTDRGKVEAFVYVWAQDNNSLKEHIVSGDWKCYRLFGKHEHLFFTYGSVINSERLKEDDVEHLFQSVNGRGLLHGYSLSFTQQSFDGGMDDIVEIGGCVEGNVYLLSREAVDYLRDREEVKQGMYRPTFVDLEMDGQIVPDVLTFVVVKKEV